MRGRNKGTATLDEVTVLYLTLIVLSECVLGWREAQANSNIVNRDKYRRDLDSGSELVPMYLGLVITQQF